MGLSSASFDEMADAPPLNEAYPALAEPVSDFIDRYLASSETVLILQGPPGTGKTRFVRAILAAISAHKDDSAKILYTADKRAFENDEIFIEFITGSHDAFVIEDADHLLMARSTATSICTAFSPLQTASCARKAVRSSSPPIYPTSVTSTKHWYGRDAASRHFAPARLIDARLKRCSRGSLPT